MVLLGGAHMTKYYGDAVIVVLPDDQQAQRAKIVAEFSRMLDHVPITAGQFIAWTVIVKDGPFEAGDCAPVEEGK